MTVFYMIKLHMVPKIKKKKNKVILNKRDELLWDSGGEKDFPP